MAHERIAALILVAACSCGDDGPSLGESVTSAMDLSVDPCQDFYRYACGGWLRETADVQTPRLSRSFDGLANSNLRTLYEILDEGEDFTLGTFYTACLDEQRAESSSRAPLAAVLADINALANVGQVPSLAAEMHALGIPVLFDLSVTASLHDPELLILEVGQGGFALPDRDLYLNPDQASRELLTAYETHVGNMLALGGLTSSTAADVVALETELAVSSTPSVALRSPENSDHLMDLAELEALAPFDWGGMFSALGVSNIRAPLNVETPGHAATVAELVANTPLATMRAYFAWTLLQQLSAHLPRAFAAEGRAFRALLYGERPAEPRWSMCAATTSWALPDRLERRFVERRFDDADLEFAGEILDRVEVSLADGLASSDWLDDTTRMRAVEKIDSVYDQVGHPSEWSIDDDAEPSRNHFGNVLLFLSSKSARRFGSVGARLDRTARYSKSWTVNAFYSASRNAIEFPAGILQPPFFAGRESVPISFGSIGAIMGHELTHALDDEGRKFDSTGALNDWWTPESIAAFDDRAACVVERYGSFEVQPGLFVDGRLTLGENIADLGGVKYAHRAFEDWIRDEGEPDPLDDTDDLDPNQLFFVAYAQGWCTNTSPEYERLRVLTDLHSPPELRANGTLSNSPAFHEAFSCEPGTPMHPEEGCEVW